MQARYAVVVTGAGLFLAGGFAPGCSSDERVFTMPSDAGQGGTDAPSSAGAGASSSTDAGANSGAEAGSGGGGSGGGGGGSGSGGGGAPGAVGCAGVTCAPEATCEAVPAPHCACASGYRDARGDGTLCEDIDECQTDNGGCDALVECNNTAGGFSCGGCPDGYEEVGGECVDIDECKTDNGGCDSLVECKNTPGGRSCGDCPDLSCGGGCCPAPPTNAVAVCEGTACGVACKPNYHACDGAPAVCYPNTDTRHCGSSCAVCSQPNATASCSSGACTYSCGAGLSLGCVYPDGRPVCSKWDFESNTVEGFALVTSTTTGSDGRFETSTKHATSGSRSLAIGYTGNNSNERIEVEIPLCPGGQGLDLTKRTLTLDLFAETATGATPYGSGGSNGNYVQVKGKGGEYFGGCDSVTPASDTAFRWQCAASNWPTDAAEIILVLRVFARWSGTFYIDNVKLQ